MLRLLSIAVQTGGLVFILLLSLVLVTVQRAFALVSTNYRLYWCRSDGKTYVRKLAEKWTKGGRL